MVKGFLGADLATEWVRSMKSRLRWIARTPFRFWACVGYEMVNNYESEQHIQREFLFHNPLLKFSFLGNLKQSLWNCWRNTLVLWACVVHLTCQESVVRTFIVDSFLCVVGITWSPVAMLFDSFVVTTSKLPDAVILAVSKNTRQRDERWSFWGEEQRTKAFLLTFSALSWRTCAVGVTRFAFYLWKKVVTLTTIEKAVIIGEFVTNGKRQTTAAFCLS